MADDIDDFETQEEWKQMVQVIMFNIPEDKIELNNDQYITEFMDNVYMNYAPINDEDDITENKSLKTENKDEWVKNWEELNSMIEYYAEQEGFTLNDNDLYDITNVLAEKGVLDTFADFKSNEDKAKNTIIAAIEQFPNKVEESTEDLDDDDDDFPYDNTTEKKCPKCGKTYTDFPALSRKDNKTYICPQCGGKEAMEDYLKSLKEDNSVDTEEFKVGDVVTDLIDNDLAVIEEIDEWTEQNIHDELMKLPEKFGLKTGQVLWPLRTAVTGKAFTPGGAVEWTYILGKDETLKRINKGIQIL